jgi:LysR family transcriptional regulator for metE and metH
LNPIDALLESKLDLAIVNDASDDRRLRFVELFDDEHVAIVSPSHPWAERAWVSPAELVTEQLYLYSRSIEDSFLVQKVLRPAGVPLRCVTYLQLTEGILEMVKAGMGISVLPRWSIVNVIAAAQIIPIRITRHGVFRKWFAATLRDAPPTPFVDEFIRLLVQHGPAAAKPRRRRPA